MPTSAQDIFILFFAIYFGSIIERSHEMYNPWDTYNAWKGKPHDLKRLLVAWIILFAIPMINFAILFVLLGAADVRIDITVRGITNVVFIGFGSFFEFGYFRIYEAFLQGFPESFFAHEDLIVLKSSRRMRPDFLAHLIPGVLYVIISTLIVLMAIYL
jgi:hypothetical protein